MSVVFIPTFLYLHQKIQIYVEAYRLSRNFCRHNELLDKRDYLMYNFSKEVSLAKVNQWAQLENFRPVGRERVVALNIKPKEQIARNNLTQFLSRLLKTSTSTSAALAKEKR